MEPASATVVVVDDEPSVRQLICSVLEDEGYTVICLQHPVLTDKLKEKEPQPHLFMLDIMLPTMSGIELARKLRQEGFAETPMIAMSASLAMLDIAQRSQLFQDSLPKPFDLDVLLHAVERHLDTD